MQEELTRFAEGLDADQQRQFAALLGQLADRLEVDGDVEGFSDGKIQQSLSLLSSVSRMLHETQLSIIENLR